MGKVIKAIFDQLGGNEVTTESRYQYDYGMVLKFGGAVTLPQAYEVHFALDKTGDAVTQIGGADGVTVPDSMFTSGSPIYAWVYLHDGETDGYTQYTAIIPVIKRAAPSDQEPTPVQQSAIDQAIAALGVAVEQTAADVETTTEKAAEAQASAEAAAASAAEAAETAENVEENVTAARAAKAAAEAARDRAVQAETSANQSKSAAATSEANAAASATAASASAAAALTSEENANGAMMSAYSDANRADTAADTATSAKNDAVSAKTAAQSAKTAAETAASTATTKASEAAASATTASTAASTATTKAGEAATSATNAAASAQSVASSAAQITQNAEDIDALKEDLSSLVEMSKFVVPASTGHSSTIDQIVTNVKAGEVVYLTFESDVLVENSGFIMYNGESSVASISNVRSGAIYQFVFDAPITKIGLFRAPADESYSATIKVYRDKSLLFDKLVKPQIDSELLLNAKGQRTFSSMATFANGGLKTNGTFEYSQPYRVSCAEHILTTEDITVRVKSGYKWGFIPFVNGVAGSWVGWITSDYTIPANTEFIVQIAKVTELTQIASDINEFVGAITFDTPIGQNLTDVNDLLNYSVVDLTENARWENGTITSDGTYGPSTTQIRSTFIYVGDLSSLNVGIKRGYQFGWHFYDATYTCVSSAQDWVRTDAMLDVPTNAVYVRFNLTTNPQTTADLDWADNISLSVPVSGPIDDIYAITTALDHKQVDLLTDSEWAIGSITRNGVSYDDSTVIRTWYINIPVCAEVHIDIDTGYKFGWHLYDANLVHILSSGAFSNGNLTLPVPTNAKYIRFNMCPVTSASADLEWASHLNAICDEYGLLQTIGDVKSANLVGNGNAVYTGERINLATQESKYKCGISVYLDYNSNEYPNIADYALTANQSMAIFGGYIFLVCGNNKIVIADYESGSIIGVATSPVTSNNHHNSAQFSDYYYDANDEFPLLFVARCGNTVATEPSPYDTCLVYRITRNGTAFTITLIKEISTDIVTYGNSWSFDIDEHTISMVGYVNANYQTTSNNPLFVFKWKAPTKAELMSNDSIELNRVDCIAITNVPYVLLQASTAFNGNMYITCGSQGVQRVLRLNAHTPYVLSQIPLPDTAESEGIAVYDGAIYVSHRRSNAENPLTIYKIVCS